jgi:phytoene desaturase
VIEALMAIAERSGVHFLFDAPVEGILVDGHRASGVSLRNGRQLPCDIVVANADLGYVYRHLLPDDGTADIIDRKQYGCSTVMFYWGLDRQYPDLAAHNLFFSGDYRRSFDVIFRELSMPERPNFYVHAPARIDPSMAPRGQDTLVVAVPVGHINNEKPQDWTAIKSKLRSFIFQRLAQAGITGIQSHIKFEANYCPEEWKRLYNLTRGSAHGLSHKITQMAFLRPGNRHRRYRNLYFVGASTHPGTGMPTVMVSARLVAERVLKEHRGAPAN